MKNKIIITFAVIVFLVPQVTFAAWWNPTTWKFFNATSQKKVQEKTIVPSNPPNLPLQKENSGSMEKKDAQKKTTSQAPAIEKIKKAPTPVKKVVIPIKKISEKKTEKPKSKPEATQPSTRSYSLEELLQMGAQPLSSGGSIKDKIPYVVQVVCPVNGGTSSGTGSIIYGVSSSDSKILTNKHVLDGATGPCGVYRTQNYESAPVLYFQSASTFIFSTVYDLAILTPDIKTLNAYSNTNFKFNQSTDVFDKGVWVLGYPPSAGNNITLTKGVVSGSENMNGIVMYKTDAKIDNGNSGGAVFDEDSNFIGVPTLASQGNYSSYGYIIPAQVVKTFLDVVEQEGYGKQNWQHPQLSLYGVNPSNIVPDLAPRSSMPTQPKNTKDLDVVLMNYKIDVQNGKDLRVSLSNAAINSPGQLCSSIINSRLTRENIYYLVLDDLSLLENEYGKYRDKISYIENNLNSWWGMIDMVKNDCQSSGFKIE